MSEIKKIGMYSTDEILEFMTEGEGRGFLGRSMFDTMYFEIERLNNIINELEKWLGESIEKHTEDYLDWKYDKNVYLAGSKKLQNVLDKLQELKGSE